MVDVSSQRRYAPTPKQRERTFASGEIDTGMSTAEKYLRHALVGIPQSILQVGELPELVKSVGSATAQSIGGRNWGEAFQESQFGGPEHVAAINNYVAQEVDKYLQELPQAEREAARPKATAAVQQSQAYHDLANKGRWNLSQSSVEKQDQLANAAGLPPVYRNTVGDDISEMIPGLLIPNPAKFAQIGNIGSKTLRYGARVLEGLLPGVTGPKNAVINATVQEGLNEGQRYLSDSPSITTGEGFLTDTGMAYKGLPGITELGDQPSPATSSNTPVQQRRLPAPQGDASAPAPFPVEQVASSGAYRTQSLPFQYTVPTAQAPAASVASPVPVAAQPNPDRDPEGGGGGKKVAIAVGALGTVALVAAALRGKVAPGSLARVIQDVDSPSAAARLDPTPTDHIRLEPSLKPGQKVRAAASKTAPLESTVRNANPVDVETKVNRINRESDAASALEVGNAAKRTQLSGEVPLTQRRTIPTSQLRMMHDTQLDAAQQELFQKAAVYSDRLDSFKLETSSLADQAADARNKAGVAKTAQLRAQYLNEASVLDQQVLSRADPNRAFDTNTTMSQVRGITSAAAADPKVNAMLTGMRKVVDDFRQAGVDAGMYSQAYADKLRRERPNFIPTGRNIFEEMTATEAATERIKRAAGGRSEPKRGPEMFNTHRGPQTNNNASSKVPVDSLKNVLDTLDEHVHDFHHQLRSNRAKQTWTETMFDSADWGKTVQRAHPPVAIQDFENASRGGRLYKILEEPNVYTYNANGQMHIMRTADSETARALRNNPSSTMAVADMLRRGAQKTYTGSVLSPGFAPIAAENELAVVRAKLDTKYSKGFLDQALKRAFPDTTISKFFDFVPDPTVRLQQLSAFLALASNKGVNIAGEALGNDLMSRSTLFRSMGPQQANGVAQTMIRTVNDIRTRIQFMEEHGILEHPKILHHNEGVFQDWKSAQKVVDAMPPGVSRTAKAFFNGYVGLVDSMRNSVKYAIASQNLDNLMHKHGGFDNIPNDVMRDYIKDMKHMSGDMTKAIGNEHLAKALSFVPYGTHMINSTLHLTEGMAHNKTYVMTRIITNGVAPVALSVYMLTKWMQQSNGKNDFVDHYWNKMPTWQRMTTVPTLSPTYVLGMLTGDDRPPTLNDLVFMRQAPEMVPFTGTIMAGLQATGWFGVHAQDEATWWDVAHALSSIANTNIPIIDALGKLQSDTSLPTNLSQDGDTARRMKDALGAVIGGGVKAIGVGFAAATDSWYRGGGVVNALEKGFTYGAEALKQTFPETPVSPLFGGQRRHYTKTQVRDRNQDTFGKIETISRTLSDQKYDRTQELDMGTITDPNAQTIMHELHSTANAGVMKVLRTERADLYKQITRLDQNRGNEKLSASDYTRRSEQLKMQINDKDMQEEEIFQRMEARLAARFGQLGVKDTDTAIAYVRQSQRP